MPLSSTVRRLLTPKAQAEICAFIKAGGFPAVAAEAAGISKQVFEQWMAIGSRSHCKRGQQIYKDFVAAVHQAQAIARLNAEIQAHENDPVQWLKCGPGKDSPDMPGWSTGVKPVLNAVNSRINILMDPSMQDTVSKLLKALEKHPDARLAVAKVLGQERQVIEQKPES